MGGRKRKNVKRMFFELCFLITKSSFKLRMANAYYNNNTLDIYSAFLSTQRRISMVVGPFILRSFWTSLKHRWCERCSNVLNIFAVKELRAVNWCSYSALNKGIQCKCKCLSLLMC